MRLTSDKVEHTLNLLGVEVDRVEGDEIYALCPAHEERTGRADHTASWSINSDKLTHFCFSCGYSGNIYGLVARLKGFIITSRWGGDALDYATAKDWLINGVGMDVSDIHDRMEKQKDARIRVPEPVPMTEARLAVFSDPPEWALTARRLTADAAAAYSIKWEDEHKYWITPVRHPETGKLWGWQEKGQGSRYFKNRPPGVRKSQTVFGLDRYANGPAVVVESPLDAARITASGVGWGLSTYGAVVSEQQIHLLSRVEDLYVAMDNPMFDTAGRKASEQFYEAGRKGLLEPRFFNYRALMQSAAKDPGDLTDGDVFHGVEKSVHFIRGKKLAVDLV